MEIKVLRLHKVNSDEKIKSFVDIKYGEMVIKGLKVIQGQDELFISYIREKGKDNKWYDLIYPATSTLKQEIQDTILAEYNK